MTLGYTEPMRTRWLAGVAMVMAACTGDVSGGGGGGGGGGVDGGGGGVDSPGATTAHRFCVDETTATAR